MVKCFIAFQQAKELTGVEKVHGILGGFHLIGPNAESLLESTIAELVKIEPDVLVPMHCTGWKGIHRISEEFTDAFKSLETQSNPWGFPKASRSEIATQSLHLESVVGRNRSGCVCQSVVR